MGALQKTLPMSHVLVLTGHTGAGKTTLANAVARHTCVRIVNVGDVVEEYLREQNIQVGSRQEAGHIFLEKFGVSFLGMLLGRQVNDSTNVVVDGLRLAPALGSITRIRRDSSLVCVVADEALRRARLLHRDRHSIYYNDFASEIAGLERQSDTIISNNGTIAALDQQAKRLALRFTELNR